MRDPEDLAGTVKFRRSRTGMRGRRAFLSGNPVRIIESLKAIEKRYPRPSTV